MKFRKKKKPLKSRGHTLITHYHSQSHISEQYRTMRTNIDFAKVDQELKLIMVTSANPNEGKTTTASNLAVVMAQQGQRVLLIDADLRKPTIHYTFRLNNHSGLTSVLSKQSSLEEVIFETEIAHLDVISSGPIPPNPTELLGSSSMKELLAKLSTSYQTIIIDTPPVLPVTDALVIANIVDGSILVVNSGYTDKEAAIKAKKQLENAKGKLLGTVLNQQKVKRKSEYYLYVTE